MMEINIGGGIPRREMLLALQKAELVMNDEKLRTGDDKQDKLIKTLLAVSMANK